MRSLFVLAFLSICTMSSVGAYPARRGQEASASHLTAAEVKAFEVKGKDGDLEAQLRVATAYATGNGVAKDPSVAIKWYEAAARQGSAVAQTSLGLAYMSGEGVEQDKAKAVAWYKKAARQNYPNALYSLGTAYYNGDGVDVSDATAYGWFLLAREAGSKNAIEAVRRAEEELKAETLVAGLKEIARNYERGDVLSRNETLATKWWLEAAKKDDEDARIAVATKYLDGRGVPQDFSQARKWCEEAVKRSEAQREPDPRAYYCMGIVSEYGTDAEKDPRKARDWYEKAYKLRSAQGAKALAKMYASGEGGKVNRPEAWLLYFALFRSRDESVKPQLKELKGQMTHKEWGEVLKRLAVLHFDPKDVDSLLAEGHSAK